MQRHDFALDTTVGPGVFSTSKVRYRKMSHFQISDCEHLPGLILGILLVSWLNLRHLEGEGWWDDSSPAFQSALASVDAMCGLPHTYLPGIVLLDVPANMDASPCH